MKINLPRLGVVCLAAALSSCGLLAADTNAPAAPPTSAGPGKGLNLADFFSLAQGLEINPKVVTATDGKGGTTVGLDYKFDRGTTVTSIGKDKETDVAFAFKSSGLILAEPAKVPNNVFTHTLRLSLLNLWPMSVPADSEAAKANKVRYAAIDRKFDNWERLAALPSRTETQETEMAQLVESAAPAFREIGPLHANVEGQRQWFVTSKGVDKPYDKALLDFKNRPLFLSVDLDANVEHDQTFTNVQFVGSAQIRGKILSSFFDLPFGLIRRVTGNTDGSPVNWLNRAGGPYFWGGIGYVDAHSNDARQALTTEHSAFARAHAGASYRTEIFGTTEANSVALELSWRYYYEFNAPASIHAQRLDNTSYFKATILLPKNYFVEYTDGKLPLDVAGGSTVSLGWRHNF